MISTCLVTGGFYPNVSLSHLEQVLAGVRQVQIHHEATNLMTSREGDSPVSYQESLLLTPFQSFDQLRQKAQILGMILGSPLSSQGGGRTLMYKTLPKSPLSYAIRLSSKVDQSGHQEPPVWPKLSSILILGFFKVHMHVQGQKLLGQLISTPT